jgi:membrane protein
MERPRAPVSGLYVARRTAREFLKDQCIDLAAALTYYAVLALFPGLVAVLSLVSLVGQREQTVDTLMGILTEVGAGSAADALRPTLDELASSDVGGIALIGGLVLALWSASAYVGAFGRGMNRIYEVREGRPIWKLRPLMLVLTLVLVVLVAAVGVALVLTGSAAEAVGHAVGVGDSVVTVWGIAKWPVMLAVVVLIVALLYYVTPNVAHPRFRWVSAGALVAIATWVLASAGFAVYVANFADYDRTYGSLAGVVVFLLWLWLTNLALLFGAELDAELERARQLRAGIVAEEQIQLTPRDTRRTDRAARKAAKYADQGRRIRLGHRRRHGPPAE